MNRCKRTATLNACFIAGQTIEPGHWTGKSVRKLRRQGLGKEPVKITPPRSVHVPQPAGRSLFRRILDRFFR